MKKFVLALDELEILLRYIKDEISSGVVILKGDLASGKTTFVKKFVKFIGVDDDVTSPTFSLQQCYGNEIFHYDIYNKGLEHFISLGMLEELDKDGIHFVEWGDDSLIEILSSAGIKTLSIEIKKIEDTKREYIVCTH